MGTEERAAERRRRAARLVTRRRRISSRRFRALTREAIDGLPPSIAGRIDNVDIVVKERPTAAELRSMGVPPGSSLLGLYQGTPLPSRNSGYNLALPDRITLYRRALESVSHTDEALVTQIRRTLLHELAHHFGIDDDRLAQIGAY